METIKEKERLVRKSVGDRRGHQQSALDVQIDEFCMMLKRRCATTSFGFARPRKTSTRPHKVSALSSVRMKARTRLLLATICCCCIVSFHGTVSKQARVQSAPRVIRDLTAGGDIGERGVLSSFVDRCISLMYVFLVH
jgi:hypothetical protein